jgi:DNA-binding transcriptional regulator LsrR (DeoR family)
VEVVKKVFGHLNSFRFLNPSGAAWAGFVDMKESSAILKLVEISKLYYEGNFTQAEIAKKMKISRPAVSKLLSEARSRGIVHIEIKSPLETNALLLDKLSMSYNLQGGLIVPSDSANESVTQRVLVSQAALYIERLIPSMKRIGLGWGYTMGCLVDELKSIKTKKASSGSVCPVIGSAPNDIKWFQPNELARIFAKKTGYTPHYLHAPAFPMTIKNKRLFETTQEYQSVSNLWSSLDAVIIGVGTYPSVPDQATAARFGNILKDRKAVGMLATYYYDQKGNFIESPNDIVIRIPLEELRRTKVIMIVGSGERKLSSVQGALLTGLVSHLIIDDATATQLVQ